jgi:hypothetical protein
MGDTDLMQIAAKKLSMTISIFWPPPVVDSRVARSFVFNPKIPLWVNFGGP